MFDIQSVPDWPSLIEADMADIQNDSQSVSEVVGVPRPTLVIIGWCEGTVDWEVGLFAEWAPRQVDYRVLTVDKTLTYCYRISVLTLQAYNCLSIGFEIFASFSVLFDSNTKNMIEIIRRHLKQLRLPCGVTGLIIILLWTKVHK